MSTQVNGLEPFRNLKNGATMVGRFHPTGYLVAVFPTPEDSQHAADALRQMGWADEDVLVTDGATLRVHQVEITQDRGLIDKFCALFADVDVFAKSVHKAAKDSDYRFMLIYAPTKELTEQASSVISPHAVLAQKYEALTFYEIVVGNSPGSENHNPQLQDTPL